VSELMLVGWCAVVITAGLGHLSAVWTLRRRAARIRDLPAKINTVWNERGEIIYDHPIRGQSGRSMSRQVMGFMPKEQFLYPRAGRPPIDYPNVAKGFPPL